MINDGDQCAQQHLPHKHSCSLPVRESFRQSAHACRWDSELTLGPISCSCAALPQLRHSCSATVQHKSRKLTPPPALSCRSSRLRAPNSTTHSMAMRCRKCQRHQQHRIRSAFLSLQGRAVSWLGQRTTLALQRYLHSCSGSSSSSSSSCCCSRHSNSNYISTLPLTLQYQASVSTQAAHCMKVRGSGGMRNKVVPAAILRLIRSERISSCSQAICQHTDHLCRVLLQVACRQCMPNKLSITSAG